MRRRHSRSAWSTTCGSSGSPTSVCPVPTGAKGGKYLFVPPDYKGELPGGGYFVQKMRTTRATMLGRSFLEKNDPKPVVALIKKTLKIYPYLPGGYGTSIGSALEGKATLARTPDHKLDWAFLRPEEPVKFIEGTGKVMNTVPPNDFSYFEMINDLVQKEPVGALDPEIMGSLAAIGIVKGKPFNPDARMKKILTDAAAIGTAAARTVNWKSRPAEGCSYYPNSAWTNTLFVGGYNFETPPPEVSADGAITVNPPTGARTLNARTAMFFYATFITPAMIMRLTDIGSQYLGAFVDSNGEYFDGSKTYKVTLPPNIPAEKFWSFTVYDNQTRSMLDTPQRYPRAGSQSYPTPAAEANADGSTTVYFGPSTARQASSAGNWIQTDPGKGWSTILRLYSPLEPFFTKAWRPSEIELAPLRSETADNGSCFHRASAASLHRQSRRKTYELSSTRSLRSVGIRPWANHGRACQQSRSNRKSPTSCLFWPTMSATATLGLMAAASCVGLRRRASMHWLKRDCGSRNSWWNQLAPRPERRF